MLQSAVTGTGYLGRQGIYRMEIYETVIKAVEGDITKVTEAEAIVNAANSSLLGGGGVDGAIHRAAGKELLFECRRLNGCKTGEAKITKAYHLPCSYVIHTVGPVWNNGIYKEPQLLKSCYEKSLELAVKYQIRSIAFPAISTGIYHFPKEQAAGIAVETVKEFLEKSPTVMDLVLFVLFDKESLEIYRELLK